MSRLYLKWGPEIMWTILSNFNSSETSDTNKPFPRPFAVWLFKRKQPHPFSCVCLLRDNWMARHRSRPPAHWVSRIDLIHHITALENQRQVEARKQTLLLIGDFRRTLHQCVYAFFAGDLNSEWTEKTSGAPQGTKVVSSLFLAVVNYVLVEFDKSFKYASDLSTLLKVLVDKP